MHFTASSVPHSFDRNGGLCARAARFSQEGIPVYRPGKFSLCILVKNDSRKRTRVFASMASCHRHDPTCPRDTRSFQELELYQISHGLGPLWYTFTGQATYKVFQEIAPSVIDTPPHPVTSLDLARLTTLRRKTCF